MGTDARPSKLLSMLEGFEPYFKNDLVSVYHADSNDILPGLPDRSFDLVLTDPPYGIQYLSGRQGVYNGQRQISSCKNSHGSIAGDDYYPKSTLRQMFRVAKNAVFSFCRWDNLAELPKPRSFIAWVKRNRTAGDLRHEYGRSWEGCCFWPMEDHRFICRPSDVIHHPIPSCRSHPTEKPVGLMRDILAPNAGESILDPFMGTGATLIAAADLGRRAVGIEVEEKYCKIAADRLSQKLLDFS